MAKIQEKAYGSALGVGSRRSGKKLPASSGDSRAEVLELGTEEGLGKFVIQSRSMRDLYRLATQVAGSDATILVYGESGTGKELFARLVHQLSGRRSKPFVPVNCGVLKGELFADKFFGHEAGAFTGAQRQRKGSFEMAADGTLFLDEVGEIPPPNQVDFLRVLEEKTFRRLGGEKTQPFDARIVAATNRVLHKMVGAGEFRADLYYRLNVIPVTLPPLRERIDDIPPLAEYFLEFFAKEYSKNIKRISMPAIDLLTQYQWPGNVRELRNVAERFALGLPAFKKSGSNAAQGLGFSEAVEAFERNLLSDALQRSGGNLTQASLDLGMAKTTLFDKVKKYGLAH